MRFQITGNEFKIATVFISENENRDFRRVIEEEKKRARKWAGADDNKYKKFLGHLMGTLAVRFYFLNFIEDAELKAKVFGSTRSPSATGLNLQLKVNGQDKLIGVKISFGKMFNDPEEYLDERFSIIGNREDERPLPLYILVILTCQPSELESLLKEELAVHIVGGTDRELLEKIGNYSSLIEGGPKFKLIKPIKKGFDAVQMLGVAFKIYRQEKLAALREEITELKNLRDDLKYGERMGFDKQYFYEHFVGVKFGSKPQIDWASKTCEEDYYNIIDLLRSENRLDTKKFYRSDPWLYRRRNVIIDSNYTCRICGDSAANVVHHYKDPYYNPESCLDPYYLELRCKECHEKTHGRR